MSASIAVTDSAVLAKIAEIVESNSSYKAKYETLDLLWFVVVNDHPLGCAAPVLEAVSEAQRQMLYAEGGDEQC